jgi:predicted secreted protein
MAAHAGHEVQIYLLAGSDADSAPANLAAMTGELCGADSVSYSTTRESLDKTDFKSTEDARLRFLGIKDGSISISGFYDPADTVTAEILVAHTGASDGIVWFNVIWDAATTVASLVKCTVPDWRIEASFDGRVEFSAELQMNGAPVTGLIA